MARTFQTSPRKADNPIKGISHIDKIALITLEGSGMIGVVGSSKVLFEVLSQINVNVIFITQASLRILHRIGVLAGCHQGKTSD